MYRVIKAASSVDRQYRICQDHKKRAPGYAGATEQWVIAEGTLDEIISQFQRDNPDVDVSSVRNIEDICKLYRQVNVENAKRYPNFYQREKIYVEYPDEPSGFVLLVTSDSKYGSFSGFYKSKGKVGRGFQYYFDPNESNALVMTERDAKAMKREIENRIKTKGTVAMHACIPGRYTTMPLYDLTSYELKVQPSSI